MAINDETKLDIVWKKLVFGSATTDSPDNKAGPNESISSPPQILNESIYAQSSEIPKPAPAASTPVVFVHGGVDRVECISDPSVAGDHTWLAVSNPSLGRDDEVSPDVSNALEDWVPTSFDTSYLVKVYSGDPEVSGVQLNPTATGAEWLFDYKSGTLFFPNSVPGSVLSNGIFIEGYRYVGTLGITPSGVSNESIYITSTYELLDGEFEDFILSTGTFAFLINTIVDFPCLVQCFSTADRDDTNAYTFRAIDGRLFDDGSFIQGGQRFFGPRYASIASLDGSGDTYWRITNESGSAAIITITVTSIQ